MLNWFNLKQKCVLTNTAGKSQLKLLIIDIINIVIIFGELY